MKTLKAKAFIIGSLILALVVACFISETQAQYCPNVPFFSQHDSRWVPSNPLGCCYETISKAGCAVSSAAMMLKYYDSQSNVNPGTLDTWLTANKGYKGCCDTFWPIAANYSSKVMLETARETSSLSDLNPYLDNYKPVIVRVKSLVTPGGYHFVVVLYRYSGKYYILDPSDNQRTNVTLDKYSNKIYKIIVYAKTASAPSKQINIATTWAKLKQ